MTWAGAASRTLNTPPDSEVSLLVSRSLRPLALLFLLGGLLQTPRVDAEGASVRRSALESVLRHGRDFRSRVQAAFALGRLGERGARTALERALKHDANPAVRAAAATALGKLGDPAARRALRRARRDRSAAVRVQVARALDRLRQPASRPQRGPGGARPAFRVTPREGRIDWRHVRYVLTVGPMSGGPRDRWKSLAAILQQRAARKATRYRGMLVLQAGHPVPEAWRREATRRHLPWLRLEGTVASVESRRLGRDHAVRVAVNLMLVEEPGRNIRGALSGAATATAPWASSRRARRDQWESLARQALEGAVHASLRRLPAALAQLVARR